MTTIKPIGARPALTRSLGWGAALMLLGGAGGMLFLGLMIGSLGAFGNGGFLLLPLLMVALYAGGLASAIGLVVTTASRIATIGLPPTLAIVPVVVLVAWSSNLNSYTQAGMGPKSTAWSILLPLVASPALLLTAMAVAAAAMRPMRDWRSNPAAIAYVVLAIMAATGPLLRSVYTVTQWDLAVTVLAVTRYLPFTWASRVSGIPTPVLYLLAFSATAYWQRATTKEDAGRTFAPIRLGWALVAGLSVASVMGAWAMLEHGSTKNAYLVASAIVPMLVTSTWIYWMPVAVGIATWRAWPLSRPQGPILTVAAAFPLLAWFPMWAQYAVTPTPDYDRQPPIAWNIEPGRDHAVLLPLGNDRVVRELKAKGYQEPWTESLTSPGQVSYWRPATKERFGGGDSVEISRVVKEGALSRSSTGIDAYYAYVTEEGRTRFVGSMVYPSYKTAPRFPPYLLDGTIARVDPFKSRSKPHRKSALDIMADMTSTLPANPPR